MEKEIMASASHYNKKYYINEKFEKLPELVKKDLKEICINYVEEYKCILLVGFYEDGEMFFETQVLEENECAFMEIDSKLEIKRIEREYSEVLEGLQKWWLVQKYTK
ncbi:MAG TPA: hypothetical protein DEP72_09345 [Clostridiales bacterium]|nr:MAG: hypothetical protein A2Y18_03955 [Clostridiales bacterium GWD2_32_19]HCC08345.1 hypothetical protein [Clostridiales bacterium]